MENAKRSTRCFDKPVIPVISDLSSGADLLSRASCVIVQGTSLVELPAIIKAFSQPPLRDVRVLLHLDLIAGLENSDAGLEVIAEVKRIEGVVTVHHHLIATAKRLGLLSVLRIFLSDSRALERGLKVIAKSQPDVVDFLPVAAAAKLSGDFRSLRVPRIAGGLCRTEADVKEALAAGCRAVTSTRPGLWKLNR